MKHHLDEVLLIVGLLGIVGLMIWAFISLSDNKPHQATRRYPKVTIGEVQIIPTEQR